MTYSSSIMEFYRDSPVLQGDMVRVTGKGTGYDGAKCRVIFMDNLTGMARCQVWNRHGYRDIHVSKLTIIDRQMRQLDLF